MEIEKKLVFTVTPGRSGTTYLCKLLDDVPGVGAFHEPDPNFAIAMRDAQVDANVAREFLIQLKLPAIKAIPNQVYVETSHLTAKGFIEPMIDLGLRPALIILRRPPREVAWSLLVRRTIPGRTEIGLRYLLAPFDSGVIALERWRTASHYQLCFWYALEMERRQAVYTDLAQQLGLTWVDITNRELNEWDHYERLLTELDLPRDQAMQQSHWRQSRQVHNANAESPAMPDWLAVEEQGVWSSIDPSNYDLRDRMAKRYGLDQ